MTNERQDSHITEQEQNALIFLSQTHRAIHEQRSKQDFKIVVGTLSFFALCVAARFSPNTMLPINDCLFRSVVWLAFGALAFMASYNFYMTRHASKINQGIAEKAENTIIGYIEKKKLVEFDLPPVGKKHPRQDAWSWQFIIVLLGAFVSAYLITTTSQR